MRRIGLALGLVLAFASCGADSRSGSSDSDGTGSGARNIEPNTSTTSVEEYCGVQNFKLQASAAPDLLIVQDRSGSMNDDANDNPLDNPKDLASKWVQIVAAIERVVQNMTTIEWGLMLFAVDDQCRGPDKPDVAVGMKQGLAIANALDATSPGGRTPTVAALNAAVAYFKTVNDNHPHYILLATDGEPNCKSDDPFGNEDDSSGAVLAVENAANEGIHTFVVGIGGNTGADATLTLMAKVGYEPNNTIGEKPYYSVDTTSDLLDVLDKIAGQIVSCSYALDKPPVNPEFVIVKSNGATIPHDKTHSNGWDFGAGDLSITLYGQPCAAIQSGLVTSMQAIFGCPPVM